MLELRSGECPGSRHRTCGAVVVFQAAPVCPVTHIILYRAVHVQLWHWATARYAPIAALAHC